MTEDKKPDSAMALFGRYFSVLAMVPASAFTGYAIGYGLDYLFSTSILRMVFLILGVAAGLVQLFRDLNRDVK